MRDALTTSHEQQLLRSGGVTSPTLSRDAIMVDCIVNTGEGRHTWLGISKHSPHFSTAHCYPHHVALIAIPRHLISAVGFPLVGGPAGTMEGGRQSEIAKGILGSKNVPYVVAAPLLIQVGGAGWLAAGWQVLAWQQLSAPFLSGICRARGAECCFVLQDMATWVRDGISGLQSVVLYSLPELDGAIDTGGWG